MPVTRLTARNVGTLKPIEGERTDYIDDAVSGFMLRVSPTGARSYAVLYYSPEGKRTRFTIGDVSRVSLADARGLAREVLADVTKGEDPHAVKVARRARGGDTFSTLCDRFLDDQKDKLRLSTWEGWRRYIEVEVKPVLGNMRPEEVGRAHVRGLVDRIVKRGSPVSANRCFEVTRRVFTWAVSKDLLPASPCVGLEVTQEERRRERVYSSDELRAILAAVPGTELEDLVPFILRTGARSGEARSARWSEFDFGQSLWTIPGEKAKNGESHPVPLSKGALSILAHIHERQGDPSSEWVFPAPTREGFMDKPNKHVYLARQRSGVADFRLHDVRRTVATGLAALGTLDPIVEAVLGHAQPGLRATYNRYQPLREMRTALDAWDRHVTGIVSGRDQGAVVAFARG
jgi:integrase